MSWTRRRSPCGDCQFHDILTPILPVSILLKMTHMNETILFIMILPVSIKYAWRWPCRSQDKTPHNDSASFKTTYITMTRPSTRNCSSWWPCRGQHQSLHSWKNHWDGNFTIYKKKMVLCYNYFANLLLFKLNIFFFWHDFTKFGSATDVSMGMPSQYPNSLQNVAKTESSLFSTLETSVVSDLSSRRWVGGKVGGWRTAAARGFTTCILLSSNYSRRSSLSYLSSTSS